ncbi:MAG: hypothetical protein AB1427_03085 [Thermodesulfobacteriota bacterium]
MKAKRIGMTLVIVILLFGMIPGTADGEQKEKGYRARVRLSVIAAERIHRQIMDFMAIDLKKLGDVILTDKNFDWHLAVTGVELLTAEGKRTGVAISTVIMEPVPEPVVRSIITVLEKEGSTPAALEALKSKQLVEVKSSWLRADTDTAIRQLCRGIIADFDAQYLQPERMKDQRRHQQ